MGYISNDSLITLNVRQMQIAEMDVNCHGLPEEPIKNEVIERGYEWEENLYQRLLLEYEAKTGRIAKRW